MSKITIVTGLWDIGRDKLSNDWSRTFSHYLSKFEQLLKIDENMIIYGDYELQKFVSERRNPENTQFILRNIDWFKNNEYFQLIQKIRLDENWFNQVTWLKDSTQAKLEFYNPLVMSKVFLLNDAKIMDKFNSQYLFWLDAGITNTVHPGYFTHDKVLEKIPNVIDKFTFLAFPYDAETEIHGFNYEELNKLSGNRVGVVGRGGFFGGNKSQITEINTLYYSLLVDTLNKGLMGTEESIFSILIYKYPELVSYFKIEPNGLLSSFFEKLKNNEVEKVESKEGLNTANVGLYVITFNSPNQFETLIKSMLEYDSDFITKTKKYLLDNSTDLSTTPRYKELCEQYNFEHIKKDNLGICGGRQFVSDHFNDSDLDVMIWSEDDMFFQKNLGETCRNGFNRYTSNLFEKSLEILKKEKFDFLKLNFTEFYGSNDVQFSWYNTPQEFRQKHWPNNPKLPTQGLDPEAPLTEFKNIKSHKGLPYITGEIFYCNWTHLVTKDGNRKMFQNTKFQHPYENTWMSFIYQETIKGVIKPGLLLLTPIEHNRFHHYDSSLRKEC